MSSGATGSVCLDVRVASLWSCEKQSLLFQPPSLLPVCYMFVTAALTDCSPGKCYNANIVTCLTLHGPAFNNILAT